MLGTMREDDCRAVLIPGSESSKTSARVSSPAFAACAFASRRAGSAGLAERPYRLAADGAVRPRHRSGGSLADSLAGLAGMAPHPGGHGAGGSADGIDSGRTAHSRRRFAADYTRRLDRPGRRAAAGAALQADRRQVVATAMARQLPSAFFRHRPRMEAGQPI